MCEGSKFSEALIGALGRGVNLILDNGAGLKGKLMVVDCKGLVKIEGQDKSEAWVLESSIVSLVVLPEAAEIVVPKPVLVPGSRGH